MILKTIFSQPQSLLIIIVLLLGVKLVLKYNSSNQKEAPSLSIANAQNIGQRRRQEDSFATIKDEEQILAVVADGMGGFNSGKEASELITKTFIEQFCRTYDINSVNQFLINTLHSSNQKLQEKIGTEEIGTTLIAAMIENDLLHWVAVGDSHLYLLRGKQLSQLNTDHIFAKKLQDSYRAGEISRYKMLNHPQRERLTSYMGQENLAEVDYSIDPQELKSGDKVVLCTDGVYDSLTELEFSQVLAQQKDVQLIAEEVIAKVLAKEEPKQDNATIVILEKN